MNIQKLYKQFAAQNGTVEFAGKTYALIDQAELTNRLFCGGWHDANDGQEYIAEYSAAAMGEDGYEYVVTWRFDVIKGCEPDSSDFNWNNVYNVIAA